MAQTIPNYDATFCGKLPLHQTNLIQPHGALFVLDAKTLTILQVSESVELLTGKKPADLIEQSFGSLLDNNSLLQLQQIANTAQSAKKPLRLYVSTHEGMAACSALVHTKADLILVELILPQLASGAGRSFLDAYQEIKTFMQAIGSCTDINSYVAAVAKEMRRISGFDKVMVYSFDPEWHGTVIAEEKEEEMVAYLGLRFPASDIPKPARELYFRNPYRFIPNSSSHPSRLFPLLNPRTHAFTDLSDCDLRSVAAVHLEYLKNMEVTASLSLRLVHEGKLWGLVSCHHRSPKYFSFEEMGFFELLSGMLSTQLSIVLNAVVSEKQHSLQQKLTRLVPRLHEPASLEAAVDTHAAEVLDLLNADGLAYSFNGHIQSIGQVPDVSDLNRLFYWLQVQLPDQLVHLPSLPQAFDEAFSFAAVGSGMLALPVVPEKGNFVVAFRPECVEEVSWGGNPNEALQFEADGKTYHPRNSFKVWKQTVRYTARPWSAEELNIAEAFKNVLTGIALRRLHS